MRFPTAICDGPFANDKVRLNSCAWPHGKVLQRLRVKKIVNRDETGLSGEKAA